MAMFVGAGMPSIPGPTPRKNVKKIPGKEGQARKAICRGAPAMRTAPEIIVMMPAHTALLTDVFIATLLDAAENAFSATFRRWPVLTIPFPLALLAGRVGNSTDV